MDIKKNFVIIGGGACGPKAAARARRLDANASITMVQDEVYTSYAACGLPYFISGLVKSGNELWYVTPRPSKGSATSMY